MGKMLISDIRVDRWFEMRLPNPDIKELEALVKDIKERGILVDLLVTSDGLLLDGHRRLMAAKKAGLTRVPVKKLKLEGHASWKKAVALAVNLFRRHLNVAQRANLSSSLLRLERIKARQRQVAGGKKGGKIAGKGRGKQASGNGSPPRKKECDRSTGSAAHAVGISRKTLERVESVKKKDPELTNKMLNGEISISAAYSMIKTAENTQKSEKEIFESQPRAAD